MINPGDQLIQRSEPRWQKTSSSSNRGDKKSPLPLFDAKPWWQADTFSLNPGDKKLWVDQTLVTQIDPLPLFDAKPWWQADPFTLNPGDKNFE